MKDVKEHDVMNAIMMVYNCRMEPSLPDGKQPHTAEYCLRVADADEDEPDINEVKTWGG